MTTLIKNPAGGFSLPNSVSNNIPLTPQQQATYDAAMKKYGYADPTGSVGSAPTAVAPSYSNLISTPPPSGGAVPTGLAPENNPSTSFTTALIQMLKEAQNRNTTGQANLMKQDQYITGLGLNDAGQVFKNKMLTPNAGTSLGLSAQNEFDPINLSIANQQKLASQNLGNITDLVQQTTKSYQDEQDRAERAKADLADAEYKKSVLAETIRSNKADEAYKKSNPTGGGFNSEIAIPEFTKNFQSITGPDNYVDPAEWIAARTLWGMRGGSDSSFVSNFKKYLNPLSYNKAGLSGSNTDLEALIQSLQ